MKLAPALTLLLAVIAVVLLLRRKLRPLGDLVQQAQALGAGDLGELDRIRCLLPGPARAELRRTLCPEL